MKATKRLGLITTTAFFLLFPFSSVAVSDNNLPESKGPVLMALSSSAPGTNQGFPPQVDARELPSPDPGTTVGKDFAQPASGFESPDYFSLPYFVSEISENSFCLTKKQIQSRVELRLLQHGITPGLGMIREDFPLLQISIKLSDESFALHLDLSRPSTFKAQHIAYKKDAIVWNQKVLGPHRHDLDVIYDSLDYLLAEFLSQYIAANQSSLR